MLVYFNGKIQPKDEVTISPDDRGFVFSDGVYEVILSYEGRLFKSEEHFKRLSRSLRELKIKAPDIEALKLTAQKLIHVNNLKSGQATVYIQITRGCAVRKHPFPENDIPVTVYACASSFDPPQKEWENGVKVILVPDNRWLRCDIKSISLLANIMACQQAKENMAKEAVFVRDGAVTEGSHTSFAAVFDKILFMYPDSHYVLPGITRSIIVELCHELNIPIKKYPIMADELKNADECMLLGTTTEVMPVIQIDDWIVGDGKPGRITRKLQHCLRKLIYGK